MVPLLSSAPPDWTQLPALFSSATVSYLREACSSILRQFVTLTGFLLPRADLGPLPLSSTIYPAAGPRHHPTHLLVLCSTAWSPADPHPPPPAATPLQLQCPKPYRTINSFLLPTGFQHLSLLPLAIMTERTGQAADPADPEALRFIVSQQGILLGHQEDSLQQLTSAQHDIFRRVDDISRAVMDLTSQLSNLTLSPPLPPPHTESTAAAASATSPENFRLQPEPFHGEVEACGGFLLQCQLLFQQAPRYYQTDHSKITLIINSLRGRALQWAQAYLFAHPISRLPF
ncbi:uncharacterized protein LOC118599543, partial [Oryzias melastigma]|uniref:uncharacterized protein LOC118599543 n=1 Tax=Oryzias melastigma TaxID=30732 RepID=UPI00168CB56F